jgi:hypothetical protein
MTFLLDLGVESGDGKLCFVIEDDPAPDLKRIAAYFRFTGRREFQIDAESFEFQAGESLRLFFSYRHTAARVCALLHQHGLEVRDQWIAASEEEGVFRVAGMAE